MRLEREIGQWLINKQLKLVIAESCTGGLISHKITAIPGSSEYYLGGVVSYDNSVKMKTLGVKKETLLTFGAVSREIALEMAHGVRFSISDRPSPEQIIALSTTGIAGPGGAVPGKPVGTIWIGVSCIWGEEAWKIHGTGNRSQNQNLAASVALKTLLEILKTGQIPVT